MISSQSRFGGDISNEDDINDCEEGHEKDYEVKRRTDLEVLIIVKILHLIKIQLKCRPMRVL